MSVKQQDLYDALAEAAHRAQRAPSILNTQPWRWRVGGNVLELHADRSRQLMSIDPDPRLLTRSCGAALYHARVALTAKGYDVVVDRFPGPIDVDLLAQQRLIDKREPSQQDTPGSEALLHPGLRDDQFAEYLAVLTPGDGRGEWLQAGEATSAVRLRATGAGLGMSVMSDVLEVPAARVCCALCSIPQGEPQSVLRVGFDMQPAPLASTPRRPDDVTDTMRPMATR